MAKSIPQVKGMDAILAKFNDTKLESDEFTFKMIVEKSGQPANSIRNKLSRLKSSGELTCRKISINGTMTNAYKVVVR